MRAPSPHFETYFRSSLAARRVVSPLSHLEAAVVTKISTSRGVPYDVALATYRAERTRSVQEGPFTLWEEAHYRLSSAQFAWVRARLAGSGVSELTEFCPGLAQVTVPLALEGSFRSVQLVDQEEAYWPQAVRVALNGFDPRGAIHQANHRLPGPLPKPLAQTVAPDTLLINTGTWARSPSLRGVEGDSVTLSRLLTDFPERVTRVHVVDAPLLDPLGVGMRLALRDVRRHVESASSSGWAMPQDEVAVVPRTPEGPAFFGATLRRG